jgi:hypothetical protein
MIEFNRFVLSNGLRVLVHEDHTTPMAVVNVLYDVGARDEQPDKTGFAHLFEHLMFGGSGNIPDYDEPLQRAGGENNALTSGSCSASTLSTSGCKSRCCVPVSLFNSFSTSLTAAVSCSTILDPGIFNRLGNQARQLEILVARVSFIQTLWHR